MDQLARRRPTFEQSNTPSRVEVASGTPSKIAGSGSSALPKTTIGKGKGSKKIIEVVIGSPKVSPLPTSALQSTSVVESPSTSGGSVLNKERDQLSAPGPSSEMTSASTSSVTKRKHDEKEVAKEKKKRRSAYERPRGRSSSRGPSRSHHKKRRHYSSDSDSDSSSDDSSNEMESSSGPDSEEERRMRRRAKSKSRAHSRARGRARSRSRAHFSDSDSGSDSESSMLEPVFMTFTIPNGDARMRQFDPAITFAKLLEKTYALANINQEIPINMSYDFNGMRLQLKDDEDLKALMDAAILKDLMVNIKVEKSEILAVAPTEIAASTSDVIATPAKKVAAKRSRVSKKVEDEGESSVDVPLSAIKVSKPQVHPNDNSFVSLETDDDVPLARIMITEGASSPSKKDIAKTSEKQVSEVNSSSAAEAKKAAAEAEKPKKKRRSAQEIAEAEAIKAREKEEKVAKKAADKEIKRQRANEEKRKKKAELKASAEAKANEEAEKVEQEKMIKEAEEVKKAKEEEEARVRAEAESKAKAEEEEKKAKAEEEKKAKAKAEKKSKSKSKEQKSKEDKSKSKDDLKVQSGKPAETQASPIKSTQSAEKTLAEESGASNVAEEGKKKKTARVKKSDGKDGADAKEAKTTSVNGVDAPSAEKTSLEKIKVDANKVTMNDASVKPAHPVPSKAASSPQECAICFAKDHYKLQCPIIEAGRESVEKHYKSLKEKGRRKTRVENEACKLLAGWLKENKFSAEEQQSQQNALLLYRRKNPDDPLTKQLVQAERLEDLQEQRESYEALEREMLKLKNAKANSVKKINGQVTTAPASIALDGIKDIIEKVHKDQAKMGIRRPTLASPIEIGRGKEISAPPSPSKPVDISSDEVDQLHSSPSLPLMKNSQSNGKINGVTSPTPSESELATSPMLMADDELAKQSKGNTTIKEISLPTPVEESVKDDDDSDGSSDTSDDSAEGNQEATSSVIDEDDDMEDVAEKVDTTVKEASESVSASEDDKMAEEEEEEVDEIEATQDNSKSQGKSSWLGSLLGFKSTQEQPLPSQLEPTAISSTPPSAQRLPQESTEKTIASTPTSSNRPRLAGVPRMSQLYGSKTHSPFVQTGTPNSSHSTKTNGAITSPSKRKADQSFDSDSDDHSDGSDSDKETKKDTLPLAKRAGQQQKKKPRKSLLSQMQPI